MTSKTQSAPVSTPASGASHSDTLAAANAAAMPLLEILQRCIEDEKRAWSNEDCNAIDFALGNLLSRFKVQTERMTPDTPAAADAAALPDWFAYDDSSDTMTIHGIKYSGELMRDFGRHMPTNQPFLLENRADEALTVVKLDWAVVEHRAPATSAAALKPTLMRQAVATVVSRAGDELRIGWLRPERCDVGTLLYCAVEQDTPAAKGAGGV